MSVTSSFRIQVYAPFEDFGFDLEGIGALIYRTVNERLEQHLVDGRDVKATWTKLDQILDGIQDPGVGLALLANRPEGATPEQAHNLLFWEIQFTQWRDWRAGDVQAVARAMVSCALGKKPLPLWLNGAINELCEQHMTPRDKDNHRNMKVHSIRWEMVELERRRRRGNPRNHKKNATADWAAAVEKLAGTIAECGEEAVRKSHQLIQRAGGAQSTLASYKRAVKERDQRRKKHRKKFRGRQLAESRTRGRQLPK